MQNKNPFRRDLLCRNFQHKFEQQKKINEKEKEKLSRSQRVFKNNNHVHYYSKSSNQNNVNINKETDISKKLSFNDIDDDEELDHPRPLLSDVEEEENELFILKNKFIKKIEDKKNLNILKNGKNDLNLKFIPKSTEIPKIIGLPPEQAEYNNTDIKKKRIENNDDKNINNKIINSKTINNKNIPFQKSYKSGTISRKQINNIKTQINNKMNYIVNNNDIINYNNNTDKKINPKIQQIIQTNRSKPQLNKSKKNIYENEKNSSFFQLNTKIDNNNLLMNENKDYININNNRNNIHNSNIAINSQNNANNFLIKQKSKNKIIYNNKKQQVHSVYIPKSNLKIKNENELPKKIIQEDSEKNYSRMEMTQTDPNININLKKTIQPKISKIKSLIKRKPINVTNINNLLSDNELCHLQSERGADKNNEDIPEIRKNNNNKNNILKINSTEIKHQILEKKNTSFTNIFDTQEKNPKYKTKTFEKGGKYNNIQTTYVIISKKKSTKTIPKANISPKIVDFNKYKLINPIPSANCLNYNKIYKGGGIPQRYSTDLRFQRMISNEPKKVGKNKSQNHFPIKVWDNYNTIDLNTNNDNYDLNNKNYMNSTIDRKSDMYFEPPERNSNYLINKPLNYSQNTIPIYDYNYDFYYNNYDSRNEIPNNEPYIPYNTNCNNY